MVNDMSVTNIAKYRVWSYQLSIATGVLILFSLLVISNNSYAESINFELKGSGIGISDSNNPKMYPVGIKIKLENATSIVGGSIYVRDGKDPIFAKFIPDLWTLSYEIDGSFKAEGTVNGRQNILYNVVLDGKRVLGTETGSLWKVGGIIEGNEKKFVLQYLINGKDPHPTVYYFSEKVIIPNGNAKQTNAGFYEPLDLEILRGTTVIWENHDNIGHTVQSQDGKGNVIPMFNSNIIKPGETFTYKFNEPGVNYYFCTLHPWRTGSVTVL